MFAVMPIYERFAAWRLCHELTLEVYRATESFPKREIYGLTSQARRAAISAGANLAEGSMKKGRNEFRRFLDISIGSLAELSYLLRCARDLGFFPETQWAELERRRDHAAAITWKLYKSLGPRGAGGTGETGEANPRT
jgi:four helix bundle protein